VFNFYQIFLAVLIVLASSISSSVFPPYNADAAWLTGYDYRKELTISGTASARTDYQKAIYAFAGYLGSLGEVEAGTTTYNWGANGAPYQRHVAYAQGRYWYMYFDGSNVVMTSSTNKTTWAAKTTVITGSYAAFEFSTVVDSAGTYMHMVYSATGSGDALYYKHIQLNADGTFNVGSQRTVKSGVSGYAYGDPHIILDSNGYPYIATCIYRHSQMDQAQGLATKSSTKDGTWTEEFTQNINSTLWSCPVHPSGWAALVAMSDGQVYAAVQSDGYVGEGRLYNGASWGSVEEISDVIHGSADMSLTADDSDDVFISVGNTCLVRDYSTGSWSKETVGTVTYGQSTSGIYNNEVYMFGEKTEDDSYYLCYSRRNTSGEWDDVYILRKFKIEYVGASNCGGISYEPINGYFVHYTAHGAGSPYSCQLVFSPVDDAVTLNDSTDIAIVRLLNHAESDFGDVRFTEDDGKTELSYWIEDSVSSGYAKIWVKVDSIPASPSRGTIYLYYGKPGASTTSIREDTFIEYDDFEKGNDGDTVDGEVEVDISGTGEGFPFDDLIEQWARSISADGQEIIERIMYYLIAFVSAVILGVCLPICVNFIFPLTPWVSVFFGLAVMNVVLGIFAYGYGAIDRIVPVIVTIISVCVVLLVMRGSRSATNVST